MNTCKSNITCIPLYSEAEVDPEACGTVLLGVFLGACRLFDRATIGRLLLERTFSLRVRVRVSVSVSVRFSV